MERREAFLRAYQAGVLDGVALPASLRENYHLCACLKDGERQVYLLQDRDGSPAVLKTQPTGREDSLRAEYDLLGKLRHPQIPRPLAYLEEGDREYLVREYVEGSSLAELVEAQGALSPERTRAAVVSLCRVLEHLHSQEPPVICRDIKPQNVVMDKEGRCHLIDLGAARRYCPEQAEYPGHRPAGAVRLSADGPALGHLQPGDADAFPPLREAGAPAPGSSAGAAGPDHPTVYRL